MNEIDNFKRELILRKYSQSTITTYASCLSLIISRIGENPTIDQIKDFLITIKNPSYHKQLAGTIHRYFEFVLKRPLSLADIPMPRKSEYIPVVFSIEEIKSLISVIHNKKHRAIVFLLYGCGMRVGEIIRLKNSDIDSSRMVITIRQSKGNKDRQVMLDESLLVLLREYFIEYKPKEYLFNGQFGNIYSESSVNQFLKYYATKAGLKKKIHAHLLRHSFAVHLLENGTDMSIIQKLLGHANIKTTQGYARISTLHISKIKSPLTLVA
jgi:site-specific recombinase XerD